MWRLLKKHYVFQWRPIGCGRFNTGDRAHSRAFSEKAYEMDAEPKELYVVEDAEHIDLYDRTDRIPFGRLESFFRENLK